MIIEFLLYIQYDIYYMKNKKHIHIFILLAIIFIITYIILAAKPLAKEYHFSPEWKKSISSPTVKNIKVIKPFFFIQELSVYSSTVL